MRDDILDVGWRWWSELAEQHRGDDRAICQTIVPRCFSPATASFSLHATLLFVYAAQKPADGQRRSMHKTAASPFQRIFRGGGSQAVRELCEEPPPSPSPREIVYFKVFRYRCFEFTLLGLHVTF